MNTVDVGLKAIGKGMAIVGVWIGWALAVGPLMEPALELVGSASAAVTVLGLAILCILYIAAFAVVYSATSAILDRWDKQ